MAIVNVELSEWDAMREKAKDLEKRLQDCNDEKKELTIKHNEEVRSLKDGARVIIKQEVSNFHTKAFKYSTYEIARRIAYSMHSDFGVGDTASNYLIRSILRVLDDCIFDTAIGTLSSPILDSKDTIERIVNFEDVEKEVKAHIEAKYIDEINRYKAQLKTEEKLKKEAEKWLKLQEDKLNDSYSERINDLMVKLNSLESECKDSNKIIASRDNTIKELESKIYKLEKLVPTSDKLSVLLESAGFKIKTNILGQQVIVKK